MKTFYFGYDGCSVVFSHYTRNLGTLKRDLGRMGMEFPDWID